MCERIRRFSPAIVGRIAVAAETVAKFAMLMAAMETTEVSGHVAATEAAAKMTAAETATMAPPPPPPRASAAVESTLPPSATADCLYSFII